MRRTNWNVLILTTALALTFLGAQAAAAPQPGKQEQSRQSSSNEAYQSVTTYRVSYRVNELENGKTMNSRSYVLMAQPGKTMSLRIGSKVPYSPGGNTIQYQDVGVNIDCTIGEQGSSLLVHTILDMSTVAGRQTVTSGTSNPVFGQLRLQDIAPATIGKPAFVGSLDDMASNRHYEIEVAVTKAK
jgi:hypothetical protein